MHLVSGKDWRRALPGKLSGFDPFDQAHFFKRKFRRGGDGLVERKCDKVKHAHDLTEPI
jgi:hypothetical protein